MTTTRTLMPALLIALCALSLLAAGTARSGPILDEIPNHMYVNQAAPPDGDGKSWVSVGMTHDTADFAVATIRRWWERMGSPMYPRADALLITADGGGSNGARVRLWKVEIQRLSDELGNSHPCAALPARNQQMAVLYHPVSKTCHSPRTDRIRTVLYSLTVPAR